jgi:hypothetical protein
VLESRKTEVELYYVGSAWCMTKYESLVAKVAGKTTHRKYKRMGEKDTEVDVCVR